eukprot:9753694-Alexandrium_andersonii.AAC.1
MLSVVQLQGRRQNAKTASLRQANGYAPYLRLTNVMDRDRVMVGPSPAEPADSGLGFSGVLLHRMAPL